MSDQADTLRRLMQERGPIGETSSSGPFVVTFASGKGGVGKSTLVANLGALLARSGLRVLLVDGDFGLANLDILLGVHSTVTLEQVLDGQASVQEAVIGLEPGLWLLPASSGLEHAQRWDEASKARLSRIFEECPWEMDVILVDIGAGIQEQVLSLHRPEYQSVVVITPEPTSLTDGYSLVKLLRLRRGVNKVSVIVNQAADGREGQQTFQKLKDVARRFIDVSIEYLGHCPRDEKFISSVMKRKILLDLDHGAPAVACLELLAKRLQASRSRGTDQNIGNGLGRNFGEVLRVGGNSQARLQKQLESPTKSLFMDEQARARGSRNTASSSQTGFWRTLLGEVKA